MEEQKTMKIEETLIERAAYLFLLARSSLSGRLVFGGFWLGNGHGHIVVFVFLPWRGFTYLSFCM